MQITVSLTTTPDTAKWLLENLPSTTADPYGTWSFRLSKRSDRVVLITRTGPPLPDTPMLAMARLILDRVCDLITSHPERPVLIEERDMHGDTYRFVD